MVHIKLDVSQKAYLYCRRGLISKNLFKYTDVYIVH